jgi:hypothetical protein
MKAATKISASGWFVGLASILVTALLYCADVHNAPVVAPWLDFLAERFYQWMPVLGRLVPNAAMLVSSLAVGLVFFLITTVLAACLVSSSRIRALESQMRGMQRKRRPRSVRIE